MSSRGCICATLKTGYIQQSDQHLLIAVQLCTEKEFHPLGSPIYTFSGAVGETLKGNRGGIFELMGASYAPVSESQAVSIWVIKIQLLNVTVLHAVHTTTHTLIPTPAQGPPTTESTLFDPYNKFS